MRRGLILSASAMLCACGPAQAPPHRQAQDGIAATNSIPGPVAVEPLAPQLPPPIVIANVESLPPALEGALTVEGWGPIRVGMTLDELNGVTGSKLSVAGDSEYKDYQCTFLYPKGAPEGLSVMFVDGKVTRIDVDKAGPVTYGGLGIGASAADVRRVFGATLNAEPHFYSGSPAEYLTVWTVAVPELPDGAARTPELLAGVRNARGVRFETYIDGKVTSFRAGDGSILAVEGCQ